MRFIKQLKNNVIKNYYLFKLNFAKPGAADWLIGTEMKYGGIVTNVVRNKISPIDPRPKEKLEKVGMSGGDRMFYHGYASKYAQYLQPWLRRGKAVVLAEFGILRGTGLAVWCDLFPRGDILGFDIDLSHFRRYSSQLKRLGAFKKNNPEVYVYDQFIPNQKYLAKILKNRRINICIDDGAHLEETILKTMRSVIPYLAKDFIYFIEDNQEVCHKIKEKYPDLKLESCDWLTVVSR